MELGRLIQKVRSVKGYTQEYMAQKLGITQKQYSNMEAGASKISNERKEKIAQLLEIDVATLDELAKEGVNFNFTNNKITNGGLNISKQDEAIFGLLSKRIEFLEGQVNNLQQQLKEKDDFLREVVANKVTLS